MSRASTSPPLSPEVRAARSGSSIVSTNRPAQATAAAARAEDVGLVTHRSGVSSRDLSSRAGAGGWRDEGGVKRGVMGCASFVWQQAADPLGLLPVPLGEGVRACSVAGLCFGREGPPHPGVEHPLAADCDDELGDAG